jgi:hypothetical protein
MFALIFSSCSSFFPATAGPDLPIVGETFQSPVKSTKVFNVASAWMVAEPGVLLDNATAWTIPATDETYFVNVPEGAFTYFSLGSGTIKLDDVKLVLKPQDGLIYLVLIRGTITDGIVDTDLNGTAELTGFVPGHAIYSHMPAGAYVSANWFRQQLVAATTKGFTACGLPGCSNVRVVFLDRSSHKYQMFGIPAENLDVWVLIESN